jgi:hypothetical protein
MNGFRECPYGTSPRLDMNEIGRSKRGSASKSSLRFTTFKSHSFSDVSQRFIYRLRGASKFSISESSMNVFFNRFLSDDYLKTLCSFLLHF